MITPQGQALMSFITWLNTYANTEFILAIIFGLTALLSWRFFKYSLNTPYPQYQFLILCVINLTNWITFGVISLYI